MSFFVAFWWRTLAMAACSILFLTTSTAPSSSTRTPPSSSCVRIHRSFASYVGTWTLSPAPPALRSFFTRAHLFPLMCRHCVPLILPPSWGARFCPPPRHTLVSRVRLIFPSPSPTAR
jgi:hypothetical protein